MGNHIMDEVSAHISSDRVDRWRTFYDERSSNGLNSQPTVDYVRMFSQIEPDAIIKYINTDEKSVDRHNYIGNYKIKLKKDGLIDNDFEFLKIKFLKTNFKIGKTIIANNDTSKNKIDGFLNLYEEYQRDHRTTLNKALTSYLKRTKKRHLLFRACFNGELEKNKKWFTHDENESKDFRYFEFQIPSSLIELLFNKQIADFLSEGAESNFILSDAIKRSFFNTIDNGIKNCFYGLMHYDNINYDDLSLIKTELLEVGKILFLEDSQDSNNFEQNTNLILEETIRLLIGITLNLKCCKSVNSRLDIYLFNDYEHECMGFLSRIGTQSNNDNMIGRLAQGLVAPVLKIGSSNILSIENKFIDNFGIAIQKELNAAMINENNKNKKWNDLLKRINTSKNQSDVFFFKALAATLRFATFYRPASVHEGEEQQLNFIVGYPEEVECLLAKQIELKEKNVELLLPLDFSYDKKPPVNTRSLIKSACNIFNNSDTALFVDAASVDGDWTDGYVECPRILKLELPIYLYPKARSISDLIKGNRIALIRILGRSKIDLFYEQQVVLNWTDHTAMWEIATSWSVITLREQIKLIVNAINLNKEEKEKITLRLEKIIDVCFSISRIPHEGTSICFCYEKNRLTTPINIIDNNKLKFIKYAPAMTDKIIEGLNYIPEILEKEDKDIENMLTLDGGSVFNILTGQLWARRKFMGSNPDFGPDKIMNDDGQKLFEIWDSASFNHKNINALSNMRWDNWHKYKEWGTRHQQSLAYSAVELEKVNLSDGVYIAANKPNFAVLVVSEDGGITLMHNGRVIEPDA